MAKSAKKRSVGLTPLREYPTFQGLYELHPLNNLCSDDLFAKSILIVIDWLRERIEDKGGDVSLLEKYPTPDRYSDFDISILTDDKLVEGTSNHSVYWADENTWALNIDEISDKKDNQWFKTLVTLKKLENSVALCAKTICREAIDNELEKVYRLGFITHKMMPDDDILITEFGISTEWPLYDKTIELNGKSNSEITAFKEGIVDNPKRNFPIIVQTPELFERMREEEKATEDFFDAAKMVAYSVVLNGSTRKLFNDESDKRCADILESGKGYAVISRAKDNAAVKPYIVIDDEGELKSGDFNGMCHAVKNNTRGKEFELSEVGLYNDILQKKLFANLPQEADPAQVQGLTEVIKTLQEDNTEKARNEENLLGRIEKLEDEKKILEERNLELDRKNKKYESAKMQLDDKESELLIFKDKISELEGRIAEMRDENAKIIERIRPMLELQMPSSYPRDRFLKWIRDNYSDAIIVHERAEKEFLADSKPRDFNMIARMIHYLYGLTVCTNENSGDFNCAVESSKAYDVLGEKWEATYVGDAHKHHKEAYSINISRFDSEEGNVVMLKHITNGKGMDSEAVRIYFYYDNRIGKSIIGSMPNHLPMAGLPR